MKPGFQELYTGSGLYISCVEFHSIIDLSGFDPKKIVGKLTRYFFPEKMLATYSPYDEDRSAKKAKKLNQRITHCIEGK